MSADIKWINPDSYLPPQGKKILYFSKGDVYVVQRFGKYWLPIPFTDSKFSFHESPELWAEFNFPKDFTGKLRMQIEGKIWNMDQVEEYYPEKYKDFIEMFEKELGLKNERTT